MKTKAHIEIPKEKIEEFCQKNHICKLSLFGSCIGDNFNSESDVDVLVEFEPGQTVGFFRLAGMEIKLSEIMERKVDLRTPAELSRYFRQEVTNLAKVQYAKG